MSKKKTAAVKALEEQLAFTERFIDDLRTTITTNQAQIETLITVRESIQRNIDIHTQEKKDDLPF